MSDFTFRNFCVIIGVVVMIGSGNGWTFMTTVGFVIALIGFTRLK